MSIKNFLRILPRSNGLKSFSGVSSNALFSTNNKEDTKADEASVRKTETDFIKQGNFDVQGFHLNQDNIRRKQAGAENPAGRPELNMEHYKIKRPSQFYDAKDRPNPSANVFSFHEDVLLQKQALIQIFGMASGYFTANDVWYPGSIIAFPRQVFLWDVQTASDIRPHSFDFLDVLKPTPNYVIIGTGKDKYPLEDSLYKRFRDRKIKVDVIPTFEACSTFNVCNEDGLNICAFMIPANL